MKLTHMRLTVRGTMLLMALLAIVVAFVLQQKRFASREAKLKQQLVIAHALPRGCERMRAFLGDMGIVITRTATRAEVLNVTGPYQSLPQRLPPIAVDGYYPVSSNGEVLDATGTHQLASELLDPRSYINIGADDLPDPEFGVRL